MIFNAKLENNKVYVNNQELQDIKILSQGKKNSNGLLIGDKDKAVYITIPIESLQDILDISCKILDMSSKIISKITVISLGLPTEGWAVPPSLPNDEAELLTEINTLKQEIQNLKENLQ